MAIIGADDQSRKKPVDEQLRKIIDEIGMSRRGIDPHILAELASLRAELAAHKNDRDELMRQDDKIITELKQIKEDMNRMKGFIGGVAFVMSAVGVVLGLVFSYISAPLR